MDDHNVYHSHHDDHTQHTTEDGTSDDPDRRDSAPEEEVEEKEETEGPVAEVRMGIADERDTDLEKGGQQLKKEQSRRSMRSQKEKDPNLVSWDGPDDPNNPKNWSLKRKWAATVIVSLFTFISPVSSSMVAPALDDMARDLGITNSVVISLMLSIFVLAYAIGPLFMGPLSEMYGRVPVLQLSNLFYLIFNLVCGFARNGSQMLAFRFFSGLGGSAPLAIGGGILADCWPPEQRGKAIAIYSLAPLLGPAVGPVAGGFIAENTTWRWVFWATCIADAAIQVAGLFFLQETYAPKLLQRKRDRLAKETGNDKLYAEFSSTEPFVKKWKTALSRPFIMLSTQPIIQFLAIYMAYLYGLTYLVLSTFPTLFTSPDYYAESTGIAGLHYIALGVGYFIGAQLTARFNDFMYKRLKARNNGKGRPEFRVPVMVPGAVLLPIGFFWYGWSAQGRAPWIVTDIGAAIFSAATITGFQGIQTYVVDAYTRYAASGVASITVLRSLAGFGFPLFAPYMYQALGYGWGNSLIGFIAIAIGFPAPILLWKFGETLRNKSRFAAGG